jgi:nucleotide-binding universal stress UspA family protein
MTRVVVWVTEGTWAGCVDAAVELAPGAAEFVLLHVTDSDVAEVVHGAFGGLLGRGGRDPGDRLGSGAEELLAAAGARLGRAATVVARAGAVGHEVVAACADADLLVCARDGARDRLGPRSLGRHTRFVVDHAPCAVLLVWPDRVPGLESMPGRR